MRTSLPFGAVLVVAVSTLVSAIISSQEGCIPKMSYVSQYPEWVAVTESESFLFENYSLQQNSSTPSLLLEPKNFTLYPLQHLDTSAGSSLRDNSDNKDKNDNQRQRAYVWWFLVRSLWSDYLAPFLLAPFLYYDSFLHTYPLVTKILTAGTVSFLGDLLAQMFGHVWERRKNKNKQKFDLHRSWTVAAEGLFISAPILHYAYDHMETAISNLNIGNVWLESALQVFLDVFLLDSFFTGTLMVTSALLQGHNFVQLARECRHDYIPAVRVAWMSSLSMSPLQLVNFGLIPLRFRVLVSNFQDLIWNAAVSYMAHRSRIKKRGTNNST